MTKRVNRMRGVPTRIGHRGDWENIIREEADLERISRYIRDNPVKWGQRHYPNETWGRHVGETRRRR